MRVLKGFLRTFSFYRTVVIPNAIFSFYLSTLGTWHDGPIEKSYQVADFCGLCQNVLVITMTNGDVLFLDIEKGEVRAFLKDAHVARNLQQINGSNIFQGIYGYTFLEVDAESGTVLRKMDLKEEWKRVGRESDINYIGVDVVSEGLHYFIANTNIVGVFNPKTLHIEDYYEFDFDKKQHQQLKGGKENLQIKEGKIYCLDTLGNLYELERNS
ncbi:MAG: hypothetical protein IPH66_07200 [Crocinitomicaceae bacterium]|nr:hypothetical protein [Crocinitomicaceae bacterium]